MTAQLCSKSIRLDLYVTDTEDNVYDVEMKTTGNRSVLYSDMNQERVAYYQMNNKKAIKRMKSIWKKTVAAVLAGLLALAVAGCGGGKNAAAPFNDMLKVGSAGFADSLEPTENYNGWQVARYGVGECLTRFDDKMTVRPWLAESWQVSDDKLSWTFRIRDGVTFSNGNKLTADAVRKSLERTFKKAKRATVMLEPESFTANGQELVVKTKKPCATLPGLLGDPLFLIVDVSEDGKRDFAKQGPVCTGPYMITGFSKGKCVVEVNPKYRDGKAPYKKIEINTIDDPHTRAMVLKKGEIDIAFSVGAGDLQLFQDKNKFNISETASVNSVLARLNQNPGRLLADKRIREALVCALDRQTYSKVLLKGTCISGGPLLPPSAGYGFDSLMQQDKNRFNIERARKLLAEAGWKDTNKDGFVDKDGKNLELDYYYCSSLAELPLFAEATLSDAKQVGIKINLKHVDHNSLCKLETTGGYDMLLSNIPIGDPESFMKRYFRTDKNGDNTENASGYGNPEFDQLSAQLAGEFDVAKRRETLIRMEKVLMDDAAAVVYGYPRTNLISRLGIEGARIFPCDFYRLTGDRKPALEK